MLNLTKVRIATKGNGSMNMNMEKGQYYNEYCDNDLDLVTTGESCCSGESVAESKSEMFEVQDKQLGQQKWSIFEINYLCFFVRTAEEKSELGIILIIIS